MKEARLLQYNVYMARELAEAKHAGQKAPRDISQILKGCGFGDFCETASPSKIVRFARRLLAVGRLKKADVLVMQCPAPKLYCRYFSIFKPAKTIGIIHDLRSMRECKINNGGGHYQMRLPTFPPLAA